MKKVYILFLSVLLGAASYADDIFTQDISALPQTTRAMISKYFPDVGLRGIKIDKEWTSIKEYKVMLADGTALEFAANGVFKAAENVAGLAQSLIPSAVSAYVSENYAGNKIVGIEAKPYGLEVSLSNSTDLKFDKQNKFIGVDD